MTNTTVMPLQDRHVFVVEDDSMNLAVIRTILQRAGAVVAYDYWGDATLERLLSYPFDIDIILLDIMLPNQVSGYDIYDAIRAVPQLSDIPMVVVSASDPDVEMNRARAKGFKGYIGKPLNRFRFAEMIALILDGQEIWGEIPE